jgi:hypothetical protein
MRISLKAVDIFGLTDMRPLSQNNFKLTRENGVDLFDER